MYTFNSRIRYSEADEAKTLRLVSLIDYFQDCSTFQSEDLGVGFSYTESLGAAWIVNFWQIDVERLPVLGEEVITGTSPYGFKGFMGFRNFMMSTVQGETLARAASVWSLIDLERMKPVRVTPLMEEKYELYAPFDMVYESRKILIPDTEDTERTETAAVTIGMEHLDSNHHVNNARYAAFALAAAESAAGIRGLERKFRFCIEYRKQARLGDRICPVVCRKGDGEVIVGLMDGSDAGRAEAFAAARLIRTE